MKYPLLCAFAVALPVQVAQGQNFDGMLNRLGDRLGAKVEKQVGDTSDRAVDSAFKKGEETITCAAGDPSCAPPTAKQPARESASAEASVKCVATDTNCLKDAQANKQKVEIVSEEELDSIVCSAHDVGCLQRAQKLGKKVVITD